MPVKESDHVISTLVNQLGAADGAGLPPRQRGVTRVPTVSSLRVLKVEALSGGTQVTLVWINPEPPLHRGIDHYNVYVTGLFVGSRTTQGPSAFASSPATLKLESSGGEAVTAYVQTQMKSGIVSDLFGSPSVSFTTKVSDLVNDADLEAALADRVRGAAALNNPNRIVLVGASPGEVVELGSLGTTTTVLHGNAAGAPSFGAVSLTADVTGTLPVGNGGTNKTTWTAGSVVFAGAGGTALTEDNAGLFYDDSANRLGVGTATPKSTLESGGSFGLKVKSVVFGDSPYTAASETVILVDATGGAITVALPALSGVPGRVYHVKKIDASVNAVTLDGSGAETIDGATTQVLTAQYQSFMIFAGPSEWSII